MSNHENNLLLKLTYVSPPNKLDSFLKEVLQFMIFSNKSDIRISGSVPNSTISEIWNESTDVSVIVLNSQYSISNSALKPAVSLNKDLLEEPKNAVVPKQ